MMNTREAIDRSGIIPPRSRQEKAAIRLCFVMTLLATGALMATANVTARAASTNAGAAAWELGIGAGGLSLPDYRGSDHRVSWLAPVPFVRYAGTRVRIDEEGARGLLFSTPRARLDVSLAAGVPVDADENPARAGMPDLDPTIEFGPSLQLRLTPPAGARSSWWLKLPARAVLSLDGLDADQQGVVLAPYVEYVVVRGPHRLRRTKLSLSVGPMYANGDWHDYYYRVDPAFATAQRPAYETGGGYSGSRMTVTWSQRHGQWWYGAFARYDNLSGAVFEDSPLVKDREFIAVGFAVTRVLWGGRTAAPNERWSHPANQAPEATRVTPVSKRPSSNSVNQR